MCMLIDIPINIIDISESIVNSPLYLLICSGVMRSMVDMGSQNGMIPKWPLASIETNCMVGKHGMASMAESILAGYGNYTDFETIVPIIISETTTDNGPRVDIEFYLAYGYIPVEDNAHSAALTLSYSFDDYSASVIEEFIGNAYSIDEYITSANNSLNRALNYQLIFNTEVNLMCPKKADASWQCPKTSTSKDAWDDFVEGDAEHWRFFVPHDYEGLISLFPSSQAFEKTLLNFFERGEDIDAKIGNSLPNPYYWAGNEVDIATPFLFNFVNCTYTQYWTRKILKSRFSNEKNGLPGNDDLGTMSAFVLFTSIGLFPQAGTTRFFITSPVVDSVRIEIDDILSSSSWRYKTTSISVTNKSNDRIGVHDSDMNTKMKTKITHVLEIETHDNSETNVYVYKVVLNGDQEILTPFIDRSVLLGGGLANGEGLREGNLGNVVVTKLEFYMSALPKSNMCDDD